jgi:hypothetical protein
MNAMHIRAMFRKKELTCGFSQTCLKKFVLYTISVARLIQTAKVEYGSLLTHAVQVVVARLKAPHPLAFAGLPLKELYLSFGKLIDFFLLGIGYRRIGGRVAISSHYL